MFLFANPSNADELKSEPTSGIETKTGGVWFQYSQQGQKVSYKTTSGFVGGQPARGYSFANGGNVNINPSGSPVTVSVSMGYGPYSFSASLGNVTNGVTGVSVYFPPKVRGRVYAKKTYKITQTKQMKRAFGRGAWKFDRYVTKVELVAVNYVIK